MTDNRNKDPEYLFDPLATPHPEIVEIEQALSPLRLEGDRYSRLAVMASDESRLEHSAPATRTSPIRWSMLSISIGLTALLGVVGVTSWLFSWEPGPHSPASSVATDSHGAAMFSDDRSVRISYEKAIDELAQEFEARRDGAPAEMGEALKKNLAVVDAAIREVMEARSVGEVDDELLDQLEQRYQTKVGLLQGAVRLLSES